MEAAQESPGMMTEVTHCFTDYSYAAGPGKVIKSVRRLLRGLGVEKRNLLDDPFRGYRQRHHSIAAPAPYSSPAAAMAPYSPAWFPSWALSTLTRR